MPVGAQLGILGGILLIPIGLVSPLPILFRFLIVVLGVVLIVSCASSSEKVAKRAGITLGILLLLPVAAVVFVFAICALGS
jgi:hypothetical protein